MRIDAFNCIGRKIIALSVLVTAVEFIIYKK
jgi:hypothetical protein